MYGDREGTVWDRVGRPHRDCMCYLGPPTTLLPIGMRKSPDVSPRRLSDISPQLRQLKYLVVDEAIKEDLKSSRSVEDINSASIEERIMRITGYYGYQPWSTSYKILRNFTQPSEQILRKTVPAMIFISIVTEYICVVPVYIRCKSLRVAVCCCRKMELAFASVELFELGLDQWERCSKQLIL
ncbi:hypothetical protein XENORESO_019090 [Xenotaenia resolanae]|uniref:Uncharacterized protein n=1 Tax=Xenotaenia resolanae TaxID=208358 RepID=A0ABV0X586_9TELE